MVVFSHWGGPWGGAQKEPVPGCQNNLKDGFEFSKLVFAKRIWWAQAWPRAPLKTLLTCLPRTITQTSTD